MARSQVTVTLNLGGLKKYGKSLTIKSPIVQKTIKQWVAIFRSFIQQRFIKFSNGGGDWSPLSPATLKRRRKGRGSGNVAMLRDTNQMFQALSSGAAGSFEQSFEHGESWGVTVGFGGGDAHKPGQTTIADIAAFHNFGEGVVPQRLIMVPPDAQTHALLAKVAEKNFGKLAAETNPKKNT